MAPTQWLEPDQKTEQTNAAPTQWLEPDQQATGVPSKPALVPGQRPPVVEQPGMLDTANQYYMSNPNDPWGTRVVKGLGRVAMMVPNIASAIVSPPTEEERKQGFGGASMAGPLQVQRLITEPSIKSAEHVEQMAQAQKQRDIAAGHPNRISTRVAELGGKALSMIPMVGPMALGMGEQAAKGDVAGTVTESAALGAVPEIAEQASPGGMLPGAPKPGETALPVTMKGVRAAAKGYNVARGVAPEVGAVTGAVGGFMGAGPPGAAYGAYTGSRVGKILQKLPEASETVGLSESEARVQRLQGKVKEAQAEFDKAKKVRDDYSASTAQGVNAPPEVEKAYQKAQNKLTEAQFHHEAVVEAAKGPATPAPKAEATPDQIAADLRARMVPAKEQAGMYTPPATAQNVKVPGEIAPEIVNPERAQRFENLPQPQVPPFERELPNQQGIRMGQRPALMPAPEPVQEVPKEPTIKGSPITEPARMGTPVKPQIERIGELTREGLGGKALEPNKPLREQVEKPVGEVLPPEKPEKSQVQTALDKTFGEDVGEEKTIEGEVKLSSRPDKAVLQKAKASPETMDKLLKLSNVELRQLAINAGEDMGQQVIGRGKASGAIGREAVFERLLKNNSPEDLGKMIDEGKHLPEVSGGSQGAATAIAEETKAKDLGPAASEARARAALGPGATDEEVKSLVAEMQKQVYEGPERRSTPRTAPLGAKELEEAIKQRKGPSIQTPFDVTEGAKATIEADKAMPKAESQKKSTLRDLETYNKSVGKAVPDTTKLVKDPRAIDVADAYETMKHDPDNPQVKRSYDAFKRETKDQWDHLKSQGYTMDISEKDPYKTYEDMAKDVKDNKHISVYDAKESHPPADHPMSEVEPETGLTYNSLFRAVHDVMGHAAGDNNFSEGGEENAYNLHRQSYSDKAVPALTTETKGQTSVFFNNKEVREGAELGKFPEQKAGLLPKEVYEKGPHEIDAKKAKEVVDHIKSGKDFAVLQAENPQNTRVSDVKNAELTNKLFKELKEKGYNPVAVGGNTKDVEGVTEHAFFVPDITPKDAAEIGRKYEQQGILTSQGLHDLNTDTINPIKKGEPLLTGNKARSQQYFTTVGNEDFNVPLDFDKTVKPNGEVAPKATMETARMSDEELKKAGFTQEQIENGEHLPTVSGSKLTKVEAENLAKEHLTSREEAGVSKTKTARDSFISQLMAMPDVQEATDIAKAGEGGRKWYQRSTAAFNALKDAAPRYFNDANKDNFINFLASTSPQQSVKMNLQEALHAWTKYVDMGDQSDASVRKMLSQELALPKAKVDNAMKAIKGEDLWPDLTKNKQFKVASFGQNLRGFLNDVTNDGWQALFGGKTGKEISKPTSYHPLSVIVRAAAKELGWEPAEAQAAIWAFTKAFTEKGETLPERIRMYSQDFADLMAHDPHVRSQLEDLGVDMKVLDGKLREIGQKPEVTGGASPTTERSIGKLKKRVEAARGKGAIPKPKDEGLFDYQDDTSFNPDEMK